MIDSIENDQNQNSIKNEQYINEEIQEIFINQNNINNKINQNDEQNLNYHMMTNSETYIQPKLENDNEDENENENEINENLNNIETNNEKENFIIIEKSNDIKIDLEKSKTEKIENNEENMNKINLISNTEDLKNTELESLKINEYVGQENLKSNKEYNDNEDDITSRRLTARDNNDKYLLTQEENQDNINLIDTRTFDNEKEKENLFPFRLIGDVKKKSKLLGKYHSRYIELDAIKGVFKRYRSSKEYPKRPKEIIDIRDFKLIKKLKKIKEYYDLEITYTVTNKKGEKSDKIIYFRLRHAICRNKWFDSLFAIWKYFIKGTPAPKITKNFLLFIDDRLGLIQEIGKSNEESPLRKSEINLKKFKILSLLGVGGFGTVFKVKHILTDKIYAMKVMNKNYIIKKKYLHYVVSEFEIMKTLAGFPFVLDLHYVFQSANYLYFIIDYCPNGDFTNIKKINNLQLFMAEVILAFEHIHGHNIVYRDLKPENILLDETGHIRICDFNLAKGGMTKNKRADSFCGSPMYFSPELLSGKGVDYKCDIYGIGLLMYEIVTGLPAYNAPNTRALYELIKNNYINFNVSGLFGDIKDLLEKILKKEPDERITIEEMKKHPFFKDIDFKKVIRKEYGQIIVEKKNKKKEGNNEEVNNISEGTKEKFEYEKFKLQQQKIDENKEYTILKGKITVKEMVLDQKRVMKNFVRDFYYVKKEDIEQTKDFKLDVKEPIDISSLIMEEYEFEV